MNEHAVVYIVDDDTKVLHSVRASLVSAGFKTRIFSSAKLFLACEPKELGCLIADVRMPEMDGISLLAEMARQGMHLPVILTGQADVPLAVTAMQAGAVNFIQKPLEGEIVVKAVKMAMDIDARVFEKRAQGAAARIALSILTPIELRVLEQVMAGRPNKIAAHLLGVSTRTIESHRSHIMAKLDVRDLPALVRIVVSAD